MLDLNQILSQFQQLNLQLPLRLLQNEHELQQSQQALAELPDDAAEFNDLRQLLQLLIDQYLLQHRLYPAGAAEALSFLMQEHGLKRQELPELGDAHTVTKVLEGESELNIQQIQALSRKFGVSPLVFM